MCHPKPLKHSRLSLPEIDSILMPFFEPDGKSTGDEKSQGITHLSCDETGATTKELQDSQGIGMSFRKVGGFGGEQGSVLHGSDAIVSGNEPSSGTHVLLTSAGATPEQSALGAQPNPHLKSTPSRGRRSKRIRFTGAMGDFLDGPNVWNEFAVMEAERKAQLGEEPAPLIPLAAASTFATPSTTEGEDNTREERKNSSEGQNFVVGLQEGAGEEQGSGDVGRLTRMDPGPEKATKMR